MSDIKKKFSLLNDLDNIIEQEENVLSSYYFYDVGKLIINEVYMLIPVDASLHIMLRNGYMTFKIYDGSKLLFAFEIECKALNDFHLLIRGE